MDIKLTDMEYANTNNTVFFSIAEYADPDYVTEPIRLTADYFGIPLEFAYYGIGNYKCNSETKFNKIIPYLKKQQERGKEYCLFCDARDVVFVDTPESILQRYNSMKVCGVLFNANSFCGTWPCEVIHYTNTIVQIYGGRGVVNSGVYIGKIRDVLTLIQDSIRIIACVRNDTFNSSLLSAFTPEIITNFKENKETYTNSDQFAIQTLQYLSHPLIKVDKEKEIFAVFGEKYPFVHERHPRRCYAVDWSVLGDDCYIGNACILHSPWLSKNRTAWITWIKEEVLK